MLYLIFKVLTTDKNRLTFIEIYIVLNFWFGLVIIYSTSLLICSLVLSQLLAAISSGSREMPFD